MVTVIVRVASVAWACLFLFLAACGGEGEGGSFELHIVTSDCNGQEQLSLRGDAADASELRITVEAPDLAPKEVRADISSGQVSLGQIPFGKDRVVKVEAYRTEELVAVGRSARFSVEAAGTPSVLVALRAANRFAQTSDLSNACTEMNSPRAGHSAELLTDGRILIAGGFTEFDPNGRGIGYLASAEIFDPSTGTFSVAPGMCGNNDVCLPRALAATVRLQDGRVMLVGGETFNETEQKRSSVGSAAIFDPKEKRWSLTTVMKQARRFHTATLLSNEGHVFVAGGVDSDGNILSSTEFFDPKTGEFVASAEIGVTPNAPNVAQGRAFHVAVAVGAQAVAVAGGIDGNKQIVPVAIYLQRDGAGYKMPAGPVSSLSTAVFGAGSLVLNEEFLLVGGSQQLVEATLGFEGAFGSAQWLKVPPGPGEQPGAAALKFPRVFPCVAPMDDARALVVGGFDNDHQPVAKAELATWTNGHFEVGYAGGESSEESQMGVRRAYATCTRFGEDSDRILVTGGISDGSQATARAEIYLVKRIVSEK